MILSFRQTLGEAAPDLSGRSGQKYVHERNLAVGRGKELEEPDKDGASIARHCASAQNSSMPARALHSVLPALRESAVTTLLVNTFDEDSMRVAIPRPEIHLVARFGALVRDGLDVHMPGMREKVHRKLIHGGHRAVVARLRLGVSEAVIGAPAFEIAGRVVPLADVWGAAQAHQLSSRLADARDDAEAASILADAIDERIVDTHSRHRHSLLASKAVELLARASVTDAAAALCMSERHFRRVFRDVVGVSPKAYARLVRFRRAVRVAREGREASWAGIAVMAGYYDQAHLIEEFRAIAGVTPTAFLLEINAAA